MNTLTLHGGPLDGRKVPRRDLLGDQYRAAVLQDPGDARDLTEESVLTEAIVVYRLEKRYTREFRDLYEEVHREGFDPHSRAGQGAFDRYMLLQETGRDVEERLAYVEEAPGE